MTHLVHSLINNLNQLLSAGEGRWKREVKMHPHAVLWSRSGRARAQPAQEMLKLRYCPRLAVTTPKWKPWRRKAGPVGNVTGPLSHRRQQKWWTSSSLRLAPTCCTVYTPRRESVRTYQSSGWQSCVSKIGFEQFMTNNKLNRNSDFRNRGTCSMIILILYFFSVQKGLKDSSEI